MGSLCHAGLRHLTGFPYMHSQLTASTSTLSTFSHGSHALDAEEHTTGYNPVQAAAA